MDVVANDLADMPADVAAMLPDEIAQMIEAQKAAREQQIDLLGKAIAGKRDDAVSKRKASGIEDQWLEDEEFYQGIDDANRDETKTLKPATMGGSFVGAPARQASRSTVFLNITRPYVDAAAARISDMLLPTDDRNWAIKPTPIASGIQQMQPQMPMPAPMQPGMMPQQPGMPPQDPQMQVDAEAKRRGEKAEKRIEDWLIECQYHAEVRMVFEDAAKLGTGVLKGPVPVKRKRMAATAEGVTYEERIGPASRRVSPWDLYPDPACGDSIHNGGFVIEHDTISTRSLRDLKGLPGYLSDRIDRVIEEGPGKRNAGVTSPLKSERTGDDEKFDIWYYYGILDRADLEAMGVELEDTKLEGVPAVVTLVNDTPIKAHLNPLDSGDFPYDVICWQRVAGMWAGIGVSRQIRTPQRVVNAATRNMMDNAGLSGGPILVVRRGLVEPADGKWDLTPRKVFYVREDGDARSVNDAITSINIDSRQGDLMAIIQFALKMAEDVTGLPMLLQGQQGQAPDTVGGMQMLTNNANSVLRRLAKMFDDCITEPHIRRYYEWIMQFGEEDEKGDFTIDARGSSALIERDLANQAILQMGAMVMNPAFGLDPELWIEEALKAQRLDPKKFKLSDEKKAQMAQQQPAPPPQVMVAQIREQGATQRKQMELQVKTQGDQMDAQVDMARIQRDTDRDVIYVQSESERTRIEYEARMADLQLRRELAMLDYANKNQITLDQLKVDLAKETMRLQTQRDLAAADKASQVATPAIEPPGRADNGKAFQQ